MSNQTESYVYNYTVKLTMSGDTDCSTFDRDFTFYSSVLTHPLMNYHDFSELVWDKVSEAGLDIDEDGPHVQGVFEIEGIELVQITVDVSLL
jgi:hypothetical protein